MSAPGVRPATGRQADHGRFSSRAIHDRPDHPWPNGARLAVYLGLNIEQSAFGEGLGARLGPASPKPDVLNYAWRECGNRVGVWRCLELFDELARPCGMLIHTTLFDQCPEGVEACVARGDEIIGHGHTHPHAEHQPVQMATRGDQGLWSIPYPQELMDIPAVMARQMDGKDFAQMIVDQFDEMLQPARIAEAPVAFDCTLWETLETESRQTFINRVRRLHAREGLIGTERWRAHLEDCFPVDRFGASFDVDARHRFAPGAAPAEAGGGAATSTPIDEI